MTITSLAVVRTGGVPSANAVAAPYGPSGPTIAGTSYSQVAVDDEGSKTFTVNEYGLSLQPGVRMRASAVGTASWMEGTVISYNQTTRQLSFFADLSSGDIATYSSWTLNVAGEPGSVPDSPTFKNLAGRNGGFEVWQRGSSVSVAASTTAYTCDGWYLITGANQASTVSRQAGIADGSRYCARIQRNAGWNGTDGMFFAMPLDSDELVKARGKKLQLFFTVRGGGSWSAGSLHYAVYFGTGASPIKRGVTQFPGEINCFDDLVVGLSPGGPAIQVVAGPSQVMATDVTQAEILFYWVPVGTAGVDDWFEIDDLDLRVVVGANLATTFERSDFQMDFQRCLRHFETSYPYGTQPGTSGQVPPVAVCNSASIANNAFYANVMFNVRKRVIPSMMIWSYNGVLNRSTPANFSSDHPANSATLGAYNEHFIAIANSSGGAIASGSGGFVFHWALDAGI